MTDAHFEPQTQPQFTSPSMDSTTPTSKRRKIIGQCPTCHQSFASRSELRDHMADPQTHPPADDSDAISFSEMSDYDSLDEDSYPQKKSASMQEPTLDNDGFEFVDSSEQQHGFDFLDAEPDAFPHFNAEQGSVHTMHDEDEQPSAEHASFDQQQSRQTQLPPQQKQALGVLYCDACDKYFGNEKVFKRHFMFGIKHGEEPREMRDLYYKVWGKTWAEEAREVERSWTAADGMEL